MKLYDIIENLKFVGIKNYQEIDINALTCRSSEKTANGLYFCIKGLHEDGHEYASESIENGAVCLVVEKYLNLPVTQILVEDVRETMSYISSVFYKTYASKMKFVGITGTNGKTTTTFLIREILTKMGKKVGLIGTQGIYIGSLLRSAVIDQCNLRCIAAGRERAIVTECKSICQSRCCRSSSTDTSDEKTAGESGRSYVNGSVVDTTFHSSLASRSRSLPGNTSDKLSRSHID